jgi:hypothetical protein
VTPLPELPNSFFATTTILTVDFSSHILQTTAPSSHVSFTDQSNRQEVGLRPDQSNSQEGGPTNQTERREGWGPTSQTDRTEGWGPTSQITNAPTYAPPNKTSKTFFLLTPFATPVQPSRQSSDFAVQGATSSSIIIKKQALIGS